MPTLKRLEAILAEWRKERMWGEIVIMVKDGHVNLLRVTKQEKVEDPPANDNKTYR